MASIHRVRRGLLRNLRSNAASSETEPAETITRVIRAGRENKMTFQRIAIGLFVLLIAALGVAFYIDWRLNLQVRTLKAFVEGYVFAEAVAACEKAPSSTPFKWNGAKNVSIVGLNSVKLTS